MIDKIRKTWQRYYVGGVIGIICFVAFLAGLISLIASIFCLDLFFTVSLTSENIRNYIFYFGGVVGIYGVTVSSRRARTA